MHQESADNWWTKIDQALLVFTTTDHYQLYPCKKKKNTINLNNWCWFGTGLEMWIAASEPFQMHSRSKPPLILPQYHGSRIPPKYSNQLQWRICSKWNLSNSIMSEFEKHVKIKFMTLAMDHLTRDTTWMGRARNSPSPRLPNFNVARHEPKVEPETLGPSPNLKLGSSLTWIEPAWELKRRKNSAKSRGKGRGVAYGEREREVLT